MKKMSLKIEDLEERIAPTIFVTLAVEGAPGAASVNGAIANSPLPDAAADAAGKAPVITSASC